MTAPEQQLAPFCRLPITDQRRAYIPHEHTDVAKTWRMFEPIRVCPVKEKKQ